MNGNTTKLSVTIALAVLFSAVGILTVYGLDRAGHWGGYAAIAFTAGFAVASGGVDVKPTSVEPLRDGVIDKDSIVRPVFDINDAGIGT